MIDTETEALKKQRAARLAAEALFEPLQPPPQAHPATVVTVRHRRVIALEAASMVADVPVGVDGPAASAPKVHLLEPEAMAATELPIEESTRVGLQVLPVTVSPVEVDAAAATPSKRPSKRTRTRHGPVTVTRPSLTGPMVAQAPAPPLPEPPGREIQETVTPVIPRSRPTTRAARAVVQDWPLYPTLLAQIMELKREAERVRRRESAEAIRWIRQAVRQHGLSAQDLGLRAPTH